jgi:hypothetical protein
MVISRYPVDHSLKEAGMEYEAITEKIIGCAYQVYNQSV